MSAGLDGAALEAVLPAELLGRLEPLRNKPLEVVELAGGLTNRNFKITTPEAAYVLRKSSPSSAALGIDRVAEHANTTRAAEAGVGAPVAGWLPEDGVLLIGFLEGATLDDAAFSGPGVIARAAEAIRRLHQGPRFEGEFDMFDVQSGYLAQVVANRWFLPDSYLELGSRLAEMRAVLEATSEGTVPCNNDLLAGNFIDDGTRVWLIDYEYAGNNDPCFELGNVWSECHLGPEQLEELVAAYYGRPRPSRVARSKLLGWMGQYGWTLWASIQDATSDIEFDFIEWGMEKYERAEATFFSPELDRLLEASLGVD